MSAAAEWRPLPSGAGWYDVSTDGDVRSWHHAGGGGQREVPYLLKPWVDSGGYSRVEISAAGEVRRRSVHSLVCETFIGPRPAGQIIRHMNGDPHDNRRENLAYGTMRENWADRKDHGRALRNWALTGAKARTGAPLTRKTPEERFWAKVQKTEGCWLWTASTVGGGYGQFKVNGKMMPAHRFAYEMANGSIPEGMVLDHTCRVRRCVNPGHLRAVTAKQNLENQAARGRKSLSGVRGVTWHKQAGKWQAVVVHNQLFHYVGLFSRISDAEAAAIAKRNELFTHNEEDRQKVVTL